MEYNTIDRRSIESIKDFKRYSFVNQRLFPIVTFSFFPDEKYSSLKKKKQEKKERKSRGGEAERRTLLIFIDEFFILKNFFISLFVKRDMQK